MSSSSSNGKWWIATGILAEGGEKIQGPFESQDQAIEARTRLEAERSATGDERTYWVDEED